nr:MAG TPA: hypothetical protein [Caudoviricetes sp.]
MEFDKSRVYTALNADELKVGSTVIVANDLRSLRTKVEKFDNSYEVQIRDILIESAMHRFETASGYAYVLAYLLSPPKEPKYKPFSDTETAFKIITAHGGWIKKGCTYQLITWIDIGRADGNEICFYGNWHSARSICENCTFVDDGTPVGEKVEDEEE